MIGRAGLEALLAVLVRSRNSPGAILCFHGAVPGNEHPTSAIHVSADEYRHTLDVVRGMAEIVPLRDILRRRAVGASSRGLAALTFDDAYRSLLLTGLLDDPAIHTSVFVAPALLGTRPWWDRIDEVRERGSSTQWAALEAALQVSPSDRGPDAMGYGPTGAVRHRILYAHQGRWPSEALSVLGALEEACDVPRQQEIMSWSDAEALARRSHIEIGVHTLTHPVLTELGDADVLKEISGCYELLKERLGRVAPILAVPFGLHEPRILRLSAEAGMEASLTLEGATLRRPGPIHGTPRFCMLHGESAPHQTLRFAGVIERLRGRP